MPKHLMIVKILYWIVGLASCIVGAWLTITFANSMGGTSNAIISIIRLIARLMIVAFGIMVLASALVIGSKRIWAWKLAIISGAVCVATIVFLPVGWYALSVLNRRNVRNHYGRVF